MEINQDLIMQWGLMNKLSTGHALLDTILVMLVPLLVNQLFPHIRTYVSALLSRWQSRPASKHHERMILHRVKDYYTSDEDMPNHKLQQAIMIHLNTLPDVFSQLQTADVRLAKTKRNDTRLGRSDAETSSSDGESASGGDWYPGIELEDFEVKLVPPLDEWIVITPGLRFMREEKDVNCADKVTEHVTIYTLQGDTPQLVDDFVAAAYDSYRAMLKGEQKDKTVERYLYLPMLTKKDAEDQITYRRYKLSDEKSFANFFHPEKQALLSLVDNFSHKNGKFAIQGYPQKLGFLLHGPPGTGKTTFIKALATHTKRSIINIPLARIKTNQQLMDMMMDERVKVEGEDMRVPLPFHKVIYVMEDIDAASHVVQKRGLPDRTLAQTLAGLTQTSDNKIASALIRDQQQQTHRSAVEASTTTTTTAVEVSGSRAGAATAAGERPDLRSAAVGGNTADVGVVQVLTRATSVTLEQKDVMVDPNSLGQLIGPIPASKYLQGVATNGWDTGCDALNLAGLLNVLDGVVDTPGRIVVMSTNHPEKLDPALIRPGRINRKVYLGHIAATEASLMIQHYFGTLNPQQQQQLISTWVDGAVSPAALEALCAEHETIESLLSAIQGLTGAVVYVTNDATGQAAAVCASQTAQPPQQQQGLLKQRSCSGIEIQAVIGTAAEPAAAAVKAPSPFVTVATLTTAVT